MTTIWVLVALFFFPPGHLMEVRVGAFYDQESCRAMAEDMSERSGAQARCYRAIMEQ
jgi:hypothetical protein